MISPQFRITLTVHATEVNAMNSSEANWSFESVQALVSLAKEGVPASVISLKLKRSIADVRAKLNDLGLNPPTEA
jgi:hypothetical protein